MSLCRAAKWRTRWKRPKRRRKKIGGSVVVKAQIHAGGRGKGGGVKVAKDADEAVEIGPQDLGMTLSDAPDRAGGPHRAASADRRDAAYRTRTVSGHRAGSRAQGKPVFMASEAGGMEIEEVAAKTPELILKEALDSGIRVAAVSGAQTGVRHGHSRDERERRRGRHDVAWSKAYDAMDGSLAEINPFILTKDGKVYALDAKITI